MKIDKSVIIQREILGPSSPSYNEFWLFESLVYWVSKHRGMEEWRASAWSLTTWLEFLEHSKLFSALEPSHSLFPQPRILFWSTEQSAFQTGALWPSQADCPLHSTFHHKTQLAALIIPFSISKFSYLPIYCLPSPIFTGGKLHQGWVWLTPSFL